MRKGVIFHNHGPGHDLRAGGPNGGAGARVDAALVVDFGALLEEDFAQHILFLGVRVVVLYVVVVRLVKNTGAVVVAVGVLVSNSPHLALQLRLSRHAAHAHAVDCAERAVLRGAQLRGVRLLTGEILTGKQEHLLVEPADYGNLRLLLGRSGR